MRLGHKLSLVILTPVDDKAHVLVERLDVTANGRVQLLGVQIFVPKLLKIVFGLPQLLRHQVIA